MKWGKAAAVRNSGTWDPGLSQLWSTFCSTPLTGTNVPVIFREQCAQLVPPQHTTAGARKEAVWGRAGVWLQVWGPFGFLIVGRWGWEWGVGGDEEGERSGLFACFGELAKCNQNFFSEHSSCFKKKKKCLDCNFGFMAFPMRSAFISKVKPQHKG